MAETDIGWVKGLSMWPNLIPGDILSSDYKSVTMLRPGMIAVFPERRSPEKIVHRVLRVRNFPGFTCVLTGGDRSGVDDSYYLFPGTNILQVASGVLRCGRYRKITNARIPELLSPAILVRLYCRIVRRFLW